MFRHKNLKSKVQPLRNYLKGCFPTLSERTQVMGILNVTPDSFSDGGCYFDPKSALSHAQALVAAGVDIIDIGAASTRPGAESLSWQKEWERLQPVFENLPELKIPVSIDTHHAEVARRALDHGAGLINDVTGGRGDPEILDLAAQRRVPFILMHMRGTPKSMQDLTDYGTNFLETLKAEISELINNALDAGLQAEQFILDPGLGFAKTPEQSLQILKRLKDFQSFGLPLLIGPSRKSFLKLAPEMLKEDLESAVLPSKLLVNADDFNTLLAVACGILKGAQFVRIHNVADLLAGIRRVDQIVHSKKVA